MVDNSNRHSREVLECTLAADFCEFGSSGRVFTKVEIIDALTSSSGAGESEISMSDFKVRLGSPEWALVTYRATRLDRVTGASIESLRSSVWMLRDDRWQIFFHQGTRVPVKQEHG